MNPQQRLVATLMTVPAARDARLIPAGPLDHPYVCVVDELDACHLDHTSLVTPAIDAVRARQASRAKRTPTQPRRP